MFTITCQKNPHSNLWCFDYAFSKDLQVIEEPLMHQATNVIDFILQQKYKTPPKTIDLVFDHLELYDADVSLEYKEPSLGGSLYRTTQEFVLPVPSQDVWLCPVLTYFYETPPKKLYILIAEATEGKI